MDDRSRIALTRRLLLDEFATRGVSAAVVSAPEHERIEVQGRQHAVIVDAIAAKLRDVPADDWRQFVAEMVDAFLRVSDEPDPLHQSPERILVSVRTRLLAESAIKPDRHSYAREFSDGVVQVLCLDTPDAVLTLEDDAVAQLPFSADQLFAVGQANTDAEPVDEWFDVDEPVRGLYGDSFFIASKAANLGALLRAGNVEAPEGVLFGIPNRHTILYALPETGGGLGELMRLSQVLDAYVSDPEASQPGGLISSLVYYWSPDGTVECQAGNAPFELRGEPTLYLRPGPLFSARLGLAE